MGLGVVGLYTFLCQKLMEKRAPQDGCFKSVLWNLLETVLVGWLILLPPGVGWDTMRYESKPFPYYHKLRNCYYYIKLSYTASSSTPRVHLLRPGPNIAPTGSSLASTLYLWTPPDKHPDGVVPHIFHCLHYWGVLPLCTCHAFHCHHYDLSRLPVVEPLQDLEHLPSHHPALSVVQEHQLHHGLIRRSSGSHCYSRSFQNPCYHYPPPPSFRRFW